MTIVVGGQSRKAGKTQVVCDIIAATPEVRWVAVKITPDAHEPTEGGDTARYLAAGAAEAHLITGAPPIDLPHAGNLIIESNAVLRQIVPDLFVFVEAPHRDWKDSAREVYSRADHVVQGRATDAVLDAVRRLFTAPQP
jgi:hypothetical protein